MLQTMLPDPRPSGAQILDGGAANEHDEANGVVVLVLFEGGTETFQAGIAIEEERVGVVGRPSRGRRGPEAWSTWPGVSARLLPVLE